MVYVPPFDFIKEVANVTSINGQPYASVSYQELKDIIKLFLRSVPVDDPWYRAQHKDVAHAIESGNYQSAKHHFVEEGYFEGRLPCSLRIDEAWYIRNNPDVAVGLKFGVIKSAMEHYKSHGYIEGRLPFEV